MSKKTKVPIVAIVGRANVGKSSLFNAILKRREAIVADEPGTTRDSIMGKATIASDVVASRKSPVARYKRRETRDTPKNSTNFWVVDTAGLKDPEDDFEFTIQEQIAQAVDSADVIIVMVEVGTIATEEDRRVAKMALKSKKPVILVANKLDKYRGKDLGHLQKYGIKPLFATSVTQSRGIDDLLNHLAKTLPKASLKEATDRLHLAILGRPNVGKSALFNSLGKKQQAIVADRAGTTRDINRVVVKYENREIEILDTAGIRRSGKVEKGVEKFSVIRSLAAIEQADACLLLLDVNELSVQLDQKIAGMIKEAGKGLILVVSKWDAAKDRDAFTRDALAPHIAQDFVFVPWAPLIFTSSVTGHNVTKIFDLLLEVNGRRQTKIKTSELNNWLQKTTSKHPPAGLKNRSPKLNYIVQEDDQPMPSFKIFGAHTKFLHWSYKRFMERELRNKYNFEGTPIKFWFIDKRDGDK